MGTSFRIFAGHSTYGACKLSNQKLWLVLFSQIKVVITFIILTRLL
jgi:hypothetical protein